MKINIVYDNETGKKGLEADWGFSCFMEAKNMPRILFDTGSKGSVLLRNMEKLGINPVLVDEVFISHAHCDHTGGLSDFLGMNKTAKIYVPPSFAGPAGRDVITLRGTTKLHPNVFSTGELQGIEQSMAVKTKKGLVVIAGCSHPGVGNILKAASRFGKVFALVGGLHGFRDFGLLRDLGMVCPTHCTQFKSEIRSLYPEKCIDGGAGKAIEI